MTSAGYVLGAWGVVFASGALYALGLARRGRRLARRVAPERRRWMTAAGGANEPGSGADPGQPGPRGEPGRARGRTPTGPQTRGFERT